MAIAATTEMTRHTFRIVTEDGMRFDRSRCRPLWIIVETEATDYQKTRSGIWFVYLAFSSFYA
jgi:hypothetical protein